MLKHNLHSCILPELHFIRRIQSFIIYPQSINCYLCFVKKHCLNIIEPNYQEGLGWPQQTIRLTTTLKVSGWCSTRSAGPFCWSTILFLLRPSIRRVIPYPADERLHWSLAIKRRRKLFFFARVYSVLHGALHGVLGYGIGFGSAAEITFGSFGSFSACPGGDGVDWWHMLWFRIRGSPTKGYATAGPVKTISYRKFPKRFQPGLLCWMSDDIATVAALSLLALLRRVKCWPGRFHLTWGCHAGGFLNWDASLP